MKNFWNKPITWGAYFKYFFALPMVIYMIIVAACMGGLKYTNWKRTKEFEKELENDGYFNK